LQSSFFIKKFYIFALTKKQTLKNKRSEKFLCFAIVTIIFGLITLAAFALNNGNAGLHFN
jgi:hypothetical protein